MHGSQRAPLALHTHTHTPPRHPSHLLPHLLPHPASDYVAQLRRLGKGHGVWHFNQQLLGGEVAAGRDAA